MTYWYVLVCVLLESFYDKQYLSAFYFENNSNNVVILLSNCAKYTTVDKQEMALKKPRNFSNLCQ